MNTNIIRIYSSILEKIEEIEKLFENIKHTRTEEDIKKFEDGITKAKEKLKSVYLSALEEDSKFFKIIYKIGFSFANVLAHIGVLLSRFKVKKHEKKD